ncbi:MAG TPA: HlyD family efflux transporter periplasmic adaptor subunit [Prolixibacteraceae bacterium]|nr:HlyD family efflux transporter periplasmic adaptor subunit [Prolixibacteraceae bacterium]
MKRDLLFILLAASLVSCDHRNELSDAYGNFEVEDIIVSAETTGKLLKSEVSEADKVSKNMELALVDTIPVALQLSQLEAQKASVQSKIAGVNAQIASYKQQKENIQVNYNRVVKMVQTGAATVQQKDDLEGQLKLMDKQIDAAKTQILSINKEQGVLDAQEALLKEQLSKCSVKSPIDGVVLSKYVNEGEMAVAGKPLVKIADLSVLELHCYISGDQLSSVKLGNQVKVLFDSGKNQMETIDGTVYWISDEAEFSPKIIQTKKERVKQVYGMKVKVANDGRLKVGMPGEVKF